MRIYPRETYLKRIRGFYHDAGLIKVLTGVRRCGKSCLILSIQEELIKQGISPAQIITLNLDSKEYQKVTDPDTLEKTLDALIAEAKQKENHYYIGSRCCCFIGGIGFNACVFSQLDRRHL